MNKEVIIQFVIITTTVLFPFISGLINMKKEQKRLALQRVRS